MWVALSGVSPAMWEGWTLGHRVCDRSGEGAGVGPDYSRPLKPRRGISLDVRDNGKLHGLLGQQLGSQAAIHHSACQVYARGCKDMNKQPQSLCFLEPFADNLP